jgi:hypothetical protein
MVLVDPDAGMSTSAPLANKTAQDDVEKALANWGRLRLVLIGGGNNADLVITVRKGNGKMVQATVSGEPTNDRPVVVVPSDTGIHIGVQQGRPPDSRQPRLRTHPRASVVRSGPRRTPSLFTGAARAALPWSALPFGATSPRMACARPMSPRSPNSARPSKQL